jgi:hypothetical protein
MDPNFIELELGLDVAKGETEVLYLQLNNPEGHACSRVWMTPELAGKLRDWLNENYPKTP